MALTAPPPFLRLTFQKQEHISYYGENDEKTFRAPRPPLGFAQAYNPKTCDKPAALKLFETQDKWAYAYYSTTLYEMHEDGMYKHEVDHNYWDLKRRGFEPEMTRVAEELQPKIIPNDAMEGFKIVESVSRYSTSNKLWRILDPRGFELEITTGCMENILLEGSVTKGLIEGPCIWRTGKILQMV